MRENNKDNGTEEKKDKPAIPTVHLNDFAAIDFEAANAAYTSACSMGIVIVHDKVITDRIYTLLKPTPNYYHWYNSKVHGLTRKDTDNAPIFGEIWGQISDKVKGLPFVAHGMLFDKKVLQELHRLYKIPYPNYKFYCTHKGSEVALPELEKHKLDTVAAYFGLKLDKHHNALADAEACAVIAMNIF